MKTTLLSAMIVSLGISAGAYAAAPASPISAEAEKRHADYFARGDANSDGVISKDEFMAKTAKRFDEVDSNHDGKITPQEMRTYREAKKSERMKRKAARKAARDAAKAANTAPAATPAPAAPAAKQ